MLQAYATQGFATEASEDGGEPEKNLVAFRLSILDVREARVRTPTEKDDKAISKGQLARKIFPDVRVKPGEWAELDEMARVVWTTLVGQVWTMVNPYTGSATGMQALVGERFRGMILVQGEITPVSDGSTTEAVDITDCEELIFQDFTRPLKDAVTKAEAKRVLADGGCEAAAPGEEARA